MVESMLQFVVSLEDFHYTTKPNQTSKMPRPLFPTKTSLYQQTDPAFP
jgi:hypothetical protein